MKEADGCTWVEEAWLTVSKLRRAHSGVAPGHPVWHTSATPRRDVTISGTSS